MFESTIKSIISPFAWRNGMTDDACHRLVYLLSHPKSFLYDYLCRLAKDWRKDDSRLLYNGVLSIPDRDAVQFGDELAFLKTLTLDDFTIRPIYAYPQVREFPEVQAGIDTNGALPYVLHHNKRLYFPKEMPLDAVKNLYCSYMYKEGITGCGCFAKSPHCYQSNSFKVEKGDVVLDVGSAEGMFALDSIERASRVYVFEAGDTWRAANTATFRPFGDQAVVVHKFVGGETHGQCIRLVDALKNEPNNASYFIKMDIEGSERVVLKTSLDFLKTHKVKIACTVYHRPDDAKFIQGLLEGNGFATEFSEGYTLTDMYGAQYPYFRKCLIRAKNY